MIYVNFEKLARSDKDTRSSTTFLKAVIISFLLAYTHAWNRAQS